MGYRSEVCIAVRHDFVDSFEKACAFLASNCDTKKQFFEDGEHGTYYYIDSWKWYDDYQEVQDFYAWVAALPTTDAFQYVRIGEAQDDSEDLGTLRAGIYIMRSLQLPSELQPGDLDDDTLESAEGPEEEEEA